VHLQSGWAWGPASHNKTFIEVSREEGGKPTTEREREREVGCEKSNHKGRVEAECIAIEEMIRRRGQNAILNILTKNGRATRDYGV
jgi:hypothetical protein